MNINMPVIIKIRCVCTQVVTFGVVKLIIYLYKGWFKKKIVQSGFVQKWCCVNVVAPVPEVPKIALSRLLALMEQRNCG